MLKPLLIGLLVTGAYFGLMSLIVRWVHSRLFGRARAAAEVFEKVGARILSMKRPGGFMKPAQVDLELDGKKARFQVQTYSRDYILQSIRLPPRPLPPILVRAEGSFDRLGKSLGLNREVQLGDQTFDAAAYLDSSASDELVRRVFAKASVRDRVLDLLRLGYRLHLSSDGVGASRIRGFYSAFEAAELPAVLQVLEAIDAEIPRFEASETGTLRRRMTPIYLAFGALFLGIMSFAFVPVVHPPMDDLDSIRIFGLGLLAWLLVMVALSRVFRQRPNGISLLLVTGLLLIFAVPPLFAFGTFAVNSRLDGGPVTTHTVQIEKLWRRDHEIWFPSWRPGHDRDKVGARFDVFRTLKVGDTIEIDTRPGALGWTWVPAVRRIR